MTVIVASIVASCHNGYGPTVPCLGKGRFHHPFVSGVVVVDDNVIIHSVGRSVWRAFICGLGIR